MTQASPDSIAPDAILIDQLARDAIISLPEPYRAAATHILLRIEDFPSEEVLVAMAIEDPFELTGLYEGIPLTEKSVTEPAPFPDVIWLYRRPILEEWIERGDVSLAELVQHVVVHELAHHFGWTDDDIAAVDPWWE